MSTQEGSAADASPPADPAGEPSWWHRDHPTFAAITGFYTGLLTVIIVPGGFAAILAAMFSTERAEGLFPFVVLVLAVPAGLIAAPRTRRFGRYMLLGMVLTALVVAGVAAAVLTLLIKSN